MSKFSHIDHIGIAVNNLNEAIKFYEGALGLKVTEIEELPKRGIKTAFIRLKDSCLELMEPMHESSEISKFLAKKGAGVHHVALYTDNIKECSKKLRESGVTLIYDEAKEGSKKSLVNFISPKFTGGVLLEIVQR